MRAGRPGRARSAGRPTRPGERWCARRGSDPAEARAPAANAGSRLIRSSPRTMRRRTVARIGKGTLSTCLKRPLHTPKRVRLAAPRGYCAGVDRAVETVERALDMHGPPVYVRKEIVHNKHVVEQLVRARRDLRRGGDRGARGRARRLLGARRLARRPRERRGAPAAHDRRDLPARHQGPRLRPQVRRPGLHDHHDRPRGPRRGRGDDGRGARRDHPRRDDRGRRLRRGRPIPSTSPSSRRRRFRSTRPPRSSSACASASRRSSRPSPRTSVTRRRTARSRSSSSPPSATWSSSSARPTRRTRTAWSRSPATTAPTRT